MTHDVRVADHTLGKNTKGYYLTDGTGKDVFFSVTEPDYNKPKGTILYFHGTGEFSELMRDQIRDWTGAGYRVVTFDQPGAGLSYKDSRVGSKDLLHMNSIDEQAEAASRVVEEVQNRFRDTQNGRLHFVSNGVGGLVALETAGRLSAGAVGSITQVSPIYDTDYSNIDRRAIFENRERGSITVDRIEHTAANRNIIVGDRLQAKRDEFFTIGLAGGKRAPDPMHANRAHGAITEGYMRAVTTELDRLNPQRDDLFYFRDKRPGVLDTIENNQINFAVVYDPAAKLTNTWGNDTTAEWLRHNGVRADVTKLDGAGVDLIHNPDVSARVLAAIEENVDGCLYVKTVNKLQKLGESDWRHLSRDDRMEIQRELKGMGYDVGKYGVDGVPSFGQVADTEHALAQFLTVYLDYSGRDINKFDFTPENIASTVREARLAGFAKPTETMLRSDPLYDQIQKIGELDHGHDGHHLVGTGMPAPLARPLGGKP